MRAVDIIEKKRDGGKLSPAEIDFFIQGYQNGSIPDYQAAAWAMAVLLRGMDEDETSDLTNSMANSGERLDLSQFGSLTVDKHSTGGVGDKTTLVVEPLVAACGLPVGKMSGRGLGFSGGTLDKMESIPGFRTNLSREEFLSQLEEIGLVLSGQTADLAPADGKLYALRDVTATVPAIPLIASSIMSKKIAAGAQAILLDVKVGSGAFMTSQEEARTLAELMIRIGKKNKLQVVALLSNMDQPLGEAVGNSLEVVEAIHTLQGAGPADFREHCLEAAGWMLVLGRKAADAAEGRRMAQEQLENGHAWEKFRILVERQGGDLSFIDHPERFPAADFIQPVPAGKTGWVEWIDARTVGESAVDLGAGRARKEDAIDHAVGIRVLKKVGEPVEAGETLFEVHARDRAAWQAAAERLLEGTRISTEPVPALPLFYGALE